MSEIVSRSTYGRLDGAIYAATTWYEQLPDAHDADGIELPGEPGRWRIVASTMLPEGALPVPELVAVAEIAANLAASQAALVEAQTEHAAQQVADVAAVAALGLPAEVAARLVGA
jgi:hypothetical protein